ncbi:type II secretion system F family protein [Acetivibrio cellulolyticus]|uniref:type II secretion system F family protein n=1 Tax=Acetivibrio cellulolyticus TaxID=35830 RepID=UPI0001E2F12A|nr:type II secretion system F family protein [Acetivibrio cellulolyticus]
MMNFILVSAFVSALLFSYQILKFLIGKQTPIMRLTRYTNLMEMVGGEEKRRSKQKEYKVGLGFISRGVKEAKSLDGYKKKIQLELQRAHILLKPEEYITVSIILFFAFGTFMFVLASSSSLAILVAIVGGVIGWVLPSLYIKIKIKKRLRILNDQLNDAIVLISNSLKAGYSFFQAVDIVSKEMTGPMAEEFAQLQKEVNFGTTTEKALENLVTRVTSDDLELVVTAVLIQRQVGGNLSEVLDNISTTIRERIRIKGEVKTVTAQGRMSGMIIAALPPALGFILFLINKSHVMVLFTDPIGLIILGFSVFMEIIGIYFISRIVSIEV